MSSQSDEETDAAVQLAPADLLNHFAEVQTARLALRHPRIEDSAAMFRVHGDPETHRYSPIGPDPDQATSETVLRGWIEQWERDGFGYWAIAPLGTTEVIGFGGVRRFVWRERADLDILNLYFRLTPSSWGQGYATEMATEAVRLARVYLPALPVVARTRAPNRAAMRAAERAGLLRRPDLDTSEHVILALGI